VGSCLVQEKVKWRALVASQQPTDSVIIRGFQAGLAARPVRSQAGVPLTGR